MTPAHEGRLSGRVVVVTGGAGGIDAAATLRLLEDGASVVIGDVDRDGAARLAAMVRERYGLDRFGYEPCDVSQEFDILTLLRHTVERFGGLDCMVNNAATGGAFGPDMIRRKRGIIVNLSSGWGREAAAKAAPYCATKWAVEGMTKAMSHELPPTMGVVSLHPGIIQTEALAASFGESAALYPKPDEWARVAVPFLLRITPADNGRQLSVPGMTTFRGMGKIVRSHGQSVFPVSPQEGVLS
jgi:NAD(P)-dependent dehydrogenase (short-subunit alcohol dehydrogenase family)